MWQSPAFPSNSYTFTLTAPLLPHGGLNFRVAYELMCHSTAFFTAASPQPCKVAKETHVGCEIYSSIREHRRPQFRKLCGGSRALGCPLWVRFELGPTRGSGTFTGKGGGRKAQVKGALNTGTERGLEHRVVHQGGSGRREPASPSMAPSLGLSCPTQQVKSGS